MTVAARLGQPPETVAGRLAPGLDGAMAKTPGDSGRAADAILRNAFRALEARAVPPVLTDHVETLTAAPFLLDKRA